MSNTLEFHPNFCFFIATFSPFKVSVFSYGSILESCEITKEKNPKQWKEAIGYFVFTQ